jgi:hypothetical protein
MSGVDKLDGSGPQTNYPLEADATASSKPATSTTTTGAASTAGDAPPIAAASPGVAHAPALPPPAPSALRSGGDMGELMLLLTKLRSAEGQDALKGLSKDVRSRVDKKMAENLQHAKDMIKSFHAMAKAKKAGKFGKIFGWVGKALTVVAAVATAVLIPPPAGVALAALMIGGLALNQLMQIPAVQKAMEKALGDKGMEALMIGIAALQVVSAIAITVSTGGAGAAVEAEEVAAESSEVASELSANESASVAESANETSASESAGEQADGEQAGLSKLKQGMRHVRTASQIAGAGSNIAKDGADIAVASDEKDAQLARAEADKMIAEIAKQAAYMKQTDELIQTLIKRLEQMFSTCAEAISTQHRGNQTLAMNMGMTHTNA